MFWWWTIWCLGQQTTTTEKQSDIRNETTGLSLTKHEGCCTAQLCILQEIAQCTCPAGGGWNMSYTKSRVETILHLGWRTLRTASHQGWFKEFFSGHQKGLFSSCQCMRHTAHWFPCYSLLEPTWIGVQVSSTQDLSQRLLVNGYEIHSNGHYHLSPTFPDLLKFPQQPPLSLKMLVPPLEKCLRAKWGTERE